MGQQIILFSCQHRRVSKYRLDTKVTESFPAHDEIYLWTGNEVNCDEIEMADLLLCCHLTRLDRLWLLSLSGVIASHLYR